MKRNSGRGIFGRLRRWYRSQKQPRKGIIYGVNLELTDEEQRVLSEIQKKIAAAVEMPPEIFTGEWKQKNDQKQEGDHQNE